MDGFASRTPIEPTARGFNWGAYAEKHATVVDVGGGWGPVSIGLAERFSGLKFIVQDFADIIADGPSHVPPELKDQVEFMEADFLTGQPVKGAEIYYMRAVLHNWVDDYCIRILRNLTPALKQNARIIINDAIMWEPWTLPPYTEKFRR
jgi:trans-aconitate methyltransferase